MSDAKQDAPVQLEIKIDEDTAQGVYANMAVINHTSGEFTLDFVYVQPQQPKAKVRSRVITSARGARMLLGALQAAVENYEAEHGPIRVEPLRRSDANGEVH